MGLKEKKLIFATGGTGGHIFPAIAVYQYLKKRRPEVEVLFVISGRSRDKLILEKYGCRYEILSMQPLPYSFSFVKFAIFIFAFLKSIMRSFKILREYKPGLVVGFGSYVSAPVGLAAFLRRKDIVLHEQNVLPSKTNLFLRRFAKIILLSFEETMNFLPHAADVTVRGLPHRSAVVVGNPLREELKVLKKEEAVKFLGVAADSFNILVVGGSQGAEIFNRIIPQAMGLLEPEVKRRISVIHLAGSDAEEVRRLYGQFQIKALVKDFLKEMESGLSACDLAITRAGALTLSELAFFGKPAILVPYVYDKGFQLENAKYYARNEAVFLLEEKNFSPQNLKELIEKLIDKPEDIVSMKEKMLSLKRISAAKSFSDIILEMINGG